MLATCARTTHDKDTPHTQSGYAGVLSARRTATTDGTEPRMHKCPHVACRGTLIQQQIRSTAVRLHQPELQWRSAQCTLKSTSITLSPLPPPPLPPPPRLALA